MDCEHPRLVVRPRSDQPSEWTGLKPVRARSSPPPLVLAVVVAE